MFLRGFLYSFSLSGQESDRRRNTEERHGLCCSLKMPSLFDVCECDIEAAERIEGLAVQIWSRFLIMFYILNNIWIDFAGKWVKPLFIRLHFSGGNLLWKCGDVAHSLVDFSLIHRD
jgi:hypothetical protein